MIIFLSVFFIYFVLQSRIIFSFLILILISLLKFQNALLFIFIFVGKFLFQAHRSYLNLSFFLLSILIVGIVFEEQIVEGLNFFRFAFYLEDLGRSNVSNVQESLITSSNSFFSVFLAALLLLPNFVLTPFPLSADGILQLLQSFENIFLILLTVYLFYKSYLVNKNLSVFLLVVLLIGLGIYGYVIFNTGTAVRYKFVYLFPYLVIFYLISVTNNKHRPILVNKQNES